MPPIKFNKNCKMLQHEKFSFSDERSKNKFSCTENYKKNKVKKRFTPTIGRTNSLCSLIDFARVQFDCILYCLSYPFGSRNYLRKDNHGTHHHKKNIRRMANRIARTNPVGSEHKAKPAFQNERVFARHARHDSFTSRALAAALCRHVQCMQFTLYQFNIHFF